MPEPCHSTVTFAGSGAAVNVRERQRAFGEWFDGHFARLLSPADHVPVRLAEAVRYAALGPGKRIRPYVCVRCCELAGGTASDALPAAAAIECIHAFSLTHDDLPAMDDDDLRRGRPTCHKQFDEATAILAGDALVVLAFELLSRGPVDPERTVQMVRVLAACTGWGGMIGGQAADMEGQGQPPRREHVEYIHERKTARLFEAACRLGALAGKADSVTQETLGRFGLWLGRAFQIADDLLDLTSTAATAGKETRKDAAASKQVLPRSVGEEASRRAALDAAASAVEALAPFGPQADDLRSLARFVVDRNY